MKNKLQKKDILANISSHPSVSRSVYYWYNIFFMDLTYISVYQGLIKFIVNK